MEKNAKRTHRETSSAQPWEKALPRNPQETFHSTKRRGVIPPAASVSWAAAELENLLNCPSQEFARLTGRTLVAIANARFAVSKKYPDRKFKITLRVSKRWSSGEIALIQNHGADYIARKTVRSLVAVVAMRDKFRRQGKLQEILL